MPDDEIAADHPVVPFLSTASATLAALVLAVLATVLLTGSFGSARSILVGTAITAMVFGPTMWLLLRGRLLRDVARASVAATAPTGSRHSAVRRGLREGFVLTLALAAVGTLIGSGWQDGPSVAPSMVGVGLGTSLWLGLQARDVRRAERRRDGLVHVRHDTRTVVWRRPRGASQFVLVTSD